MASPTMPIGPPRPARRKAPSAPVPRGPADPARGGVSVVFPVYNESFIIEQTLRNYVSELGERVPEVEFIVAEDGSLDDTKAVLERLAGELPIRLYTSDERKGYQQALKDAIAHARLPWLFIVDSDYQFAAIDFWRLEPLRDTHDVILGTKTPRRDPFYRVFLSWGYNRLLRLFFRIPYEDVDTGFRLIRRDLALALAPAVRHMTFFNAEFVVRAHHAGARIVGVPVPHYARKIGSTNIFHISKLFLICFRQLAGMLRLWGELRRRVVAPPTEARP